MKLNGNTKIIGSKVILVPYERKHVPKYHNWMKSAELQELTASEPLSLDEEYEMQKSWREDEDKCTFIVLHKENFDKCSNEIDSMIGDTNIFVTNGEESTGEIEIMIAESSVRGQKLGWETVILMLLYGIQHIGLKAYEAKISLKNNISIQMFKKLNFQVKSQSDIFQEITLQKPVTSLWKDWLQEQVQYEMCEYS